MFCIILSRLHSAFLIVYWSTTKDSYQVTNRIGFYFHYHKVLYWLSGLTCTDENFISKSGAQRAASSEGIALVAPDTSPSKPDFLKIHL